MKQSVLKVFLLKQSLNLEPSEAIPDPPLRFVVLDKSSTSVVILMTAVQQIHFIQTP